MVGILREDLHVLDAGIAGNVPNGYQVRLRCAVRGIDGAVAVAVVCSCGVAFHGVLRCVEGAVEASPKDGSVGALVVAVGADGVDENGGGCAGPAP